MHTLIRFFLWLMKYLISCQEKLKTFQHFHELNLAFHWYCLHDEFLSFLRFIFIMPKHENLHGQNLKM